MNQIPEIFSPLRQLHRLNCIYYQNLSDHDFTGKEKLFLVEQLRHENIDVNNSFYDGLLFKNNTKVSRCKLATCYSIHVGTIQNWIEGNRNGHILYDSDVRRIPSIDHEGMREIVVELIKLEENSVEPLSVPECHHLFEQKAAETWGRRHPNTPFQKSIHIDERTVERLKTKYRISNRVAQDLTDARWLASSDIRLTYRVAILKEAFSGHLPPMNIWNGDATTAIIQPDGTGMKVCIVREKDIKEHQVTSKAKVAGLNVLIKIFCLGNASGEIPAPALIVALDELEENFFFAREVVGMSHDSGVGKAGWLYACKSRCGNAGMWKHFFKKYVIPSIADAASVHQRKVSIPIMLNYLPYANFLYCIGSSRAALQKFPLD